jgi:hypothetical protein
VFADRLICELSLVSFFEPSALCSIAVAAFVPNTAFQWTNPRPSFWRRQSSRTAGSPLNARSLGGLPNEMLRISVVILAIVLAASSCRSSDRVNGRCAVDVRTDTVLGEVLGVTTGRASRVQVYQIRTRETSPRTFEVDIATVRVVPCTELVDGR